jgi:hypothetical protein
MDEYDMVIDNFDYTIDFYQDDKNIGEIIYEFLKKVSITKHEITINYKRYAQTEEDENLFKNIKSTVNTLRNALQVLETRLITNIGGKVQYYIVPDTNIPFKSKWILVQVYRGHRPSPITN